MAPLQVGITATASTHATKGARIIECSHICIFDQPLLSWPPGIMMGRSGGGGVPWPSRMTTGGTLIRGWGGGGGAAFDRLPHLCLCCL